MDRRQIEYYKSALPHWGLYVRQGRTWPNTLGFPSTSAGFGVDIGTTGSPSSKVQARYLTDREMEVIDQIILSREFNKVCREIFGLQYVDDKSGREVCSILNISRHRQSKLWYSGVDEIHSQICQRLKAGQF